MASVAPSAFVLDVEGQCVDIVVTVYADRVFVVVTELPSFGTLIQATPEVYPDGAVEFKIKTLLGDRDEDDFVMLLARRIVESVFRDTGLPLLLSVALRKPSEQAIRAIVVRLEAERPWRRSEAASSSS
jgi:proteasome assembly chaperone 3